MYCSNCGHKNTRKNKFCISCGSNLKAPQSRPKQKRVNQNSQIKVVAIAALAIISVLLFIIISNDKQPAQASAPLQSAAVLEIAKNFHCFCENCDDRLDVCDCTHTGGATEVKNFIAIKLKEGHRKEHIIEMVQQKFSATQKLVVPDSIKKITG